MAGKARVKVTGTQLRSWEEVDESVKRYGLLRLQREEFEAELHRKVTELRDGSAREVAPIAAEMETLERGIKEFSEAHRPDLEPAKSRVLNFGTVGFRLTSRLQIKSVAATLEALKAQGLVACIRVKEEPDKEALREYPDETLEKVGVRRVQDDTFFFEPNVERIRSMPA
jgi:phage host-nuclease inhibitor protein Gam